MASRCSAIGACMILEGVWCEPFKAAWYPYIVNDADDCVWGVVIFLLRSRGNLWRGLEEAMEEDIGASVSP